MNPSSLRLIAMERRNIGFSALIVLKDGFYPDRLADGSTSLTLSGGPDPIKKSDAVYVAVDLQPGSYSVTVRSRYFVTQQEDIVIKEPDSPPACPATIYISLRPGPAYPFPPSTILLRGNVFDAGTRLPLCGGQAALVINESGGGVTRQVTEINPFGQFVFNFAGRSESATMNVDLKIPGYCETIEPVFLDPDESVTRYNFYLEKMEVGTNSASVITSLSQEQAIPPSANHYQQP